jgi:hypothetical protein
MSTVSFLHRSSHAQLQENSKMTTDAVECKDGAAKAHDCCRTTEWKLPAGTALEHLRALMLSQAYEIYLEA